MCCVVLKVDYMMGSGVPSSTHCLAILDCNHWGCTRDVNCVFRLSLDCISDNSCLKYSCQADALVASSSLVGMFAFVYSTCFFSRICCLHSFSKVGVSTCSTRDIKGNVREKDRAMAILDTLYTTIEACNTKWSRKIERCTLILIQLLIIDCWYYLLDTIYWFQNFDYWMQWNHWCSTSRTISKVA